MGSDNPVRRNHHLLLAQWPSHNPSVCDNRARPWHNISQSKPDCVRKAGHWWKFHIGGPTTRFAPELERNVVSEHCAIVHSDLSIHDLFEQHWVSIPRLRKNQFPGFVSIASSAVFLFPHQQRGNDLVSQTSEGILVGCKVLPLFRIQPTSTHGCRLLSKER